MKKLVILAISAILVANVSAQEQKKECFKGKQLSKEERVEFDIKRLTHELMLSDEQAAKFAVTYREYTGKLDELFQKNASKEKFEPGKELSDKELDKLAKARFEGFKDLADLQLKFYNKFRKDLSARQVEKVLRLGEPGGPEQFGDKPCCGKHDGKKDCIHDGKQCGHHGHGPQGPQQFPQGPQPIPQDAPQDFPQGPLPFPQDAPQGPLPFPQDAPQDVPQK